MDGLKQFLTNVRGLRKEAFEAVRDVNRAKANECFPITQQECPVDEGVLLASGKVTNTASGAQIVYTAPHAWIAHEVLTALHKVGKAKFVEDPVRQMIAPTGEAWLAAYREVIARRAL